MNIFLPRYDSPQRATVDRMSEKEVGLEKLGLVCQSFFLVCPAILSNCLPISAQSD